MDQHLDSFIDSTIKKCLLEYDLDTNDTESILDDIEKTWSSGPSDTERSQGSPRSSPETSVVSDSQRYSRAEISSHLQHRGSPGVYDVTRGVQSVKKPHSSTSRDIHPVYQRHSSHIDSSVPLSLTNKQPCRRASQYSPQRETPPSRSIPCYTTGEFPAHLESHHSQNVVCRYITDDVGDAPTIYKPLSPPVYNSGSPPVYEAHSPSSIRSQASSSKYTYPNIHRDNTSYLAYTDNYSHHIYDRDSSPTIAKRPRIASSEFQVHSTMPDERHSENDAIRHMAYLNGLQNDIDSERVSASSTHGVIRMNHAAHNKDVSPHIDQIASDKIAASFHQVQRQFECANFEADHRDEFLCGQQRSARATSVTSPSSEGSDVTTADSDLKDCEIDVKTSKTERGSPDTTLAVAANSKPHTKLKSRLQQRYFRSQQSTDDSSTTGSHSGSEDDAKLDTSRASPHSNGSTSPDNVDIRATTPQTIRDLLAKGSRDGNNNKRSFSVSSSDVEPQLSEGAHSSPPHPSLQPHSMQHTYPSNLDLLAHVASPSADKISTNHRLQRRPSPVSQATLVDHQSRQMHELDRRVNKEVPNSIDAVIRQHFQSSQIRPDIIQPNLDSDNCPLKSILEKQLTTKSTVADNEGFGVLLLNTFYNKHDQTGYVREQSHASEELRHRDVHQLKEKPRDIPSRDHHRRNHQVHHTKDHSRNHPKDHRRDHPKDHARERPSNQPHLECKADRLNHHSSPLSIIQSRIVDIITEELTRGDPQTGSFGDQKVEQRQHQDINMRIDLNSMEHRQSYNSSIPGRHHRETPVNPTFPLATQLSDEHIARLLRAQINCSDKTSLPRDIKDKHTTSSKKMNAAPKPSRNGEASSYNHQRLSHQAWFDHLTRSQHVLTHTAAEAQDLSQRKRSAPLCKDMHGFKSIRLNEEMVSE